MICPNCHMQQPQENLAYCVSCNCPLQSRPQGFFTKSSSGFSRADVYSAARRGQQPVPYPQPSGSIQMTYDANGNQIYVQTTYDQTGNPIFIQMVPQVTGQDAYGNPIITMIPVQQNPVPAAAPYPTQNLITSVNYSMPMPSPPPVQSVQPAAAAPKRNTPVSSNGNPEFAAKSEAAPPPVPVMPRPDEQPDMETPSVPDRPAMRASAIASSMYAANQQQPSMNYGTGSFFARVQQQNITVPSNTAVPVPERNHYLYETPVSAEELLEEAETAFLPSDMPDENAVLQKIFEGRSKEYHVSSLGKKTSTFSVSLSPDEVTSVSEKTLYQNSTLPQREVRTPEPEPEPQPTSILRQEIHLFSKPKKEQPKNKTIIVDPDEIFGDGNRRKPEMLSVRIEGTDADVEKKLREFQNGGKKSTRSMKSAEQEIGISSGSYDKEKAQRVREEKAYESYESAEIEKALAQLNQGIFPKK